ncbi:uncharacterized protein N7459_000812 [Penicillium hispanicum]|uniref:uncharacterized protein n=1 Tax=Penicillium hispanicum TaxID=1080232 RepID=UPI0025420666|nr:uncharacterized protein N7459_000812 [Penicillium hispanicum]KAJ5594604.1 hypothetical protein N7459_000812 [Penicillium hispanicum]
MSFTAARAGGECSGLVSLPSGYRIFASVSGPDRTPGTPVVIIIPGIACSIKEWVVVQRLLQPTARVLLYERAGLGSSDESPDPRTAINMAHELEALLQALKLVPPYVIVCHSYGGIIAREFIEMHQQDGRRDDVVGVVFVEANQEKNIELWPDSNIEHMAEGLDWNQTSGLDQDSVLTGIEWQALVDEQSAEKHQRTMVREREHYINSCLTLETKRQLSRIPPLLGTHPISVLKGHPEIELSKVFDAAIQAGKGSLEEREQYKRKLALFPSVNDRNQRETLQLSHTHRFVNVEGCGHFIHMVRPEAVVEEVGWVLQNI